MDLKATSFDCVALDRIRVEVIGAAKFSKTHLQLIKSNPKTTLIGMLELSPSLAQWAANDRTAKKFEARQSHAVCRALLDEGKPDIVRVPTPPGTHQNFTAATGPDGSCITMRGTKGWIAARKGPAIHLEETCEALHGKGATPVSFDHMGHASGLPDALIEEGHSV